MLLDSVMLSHWWERRGGEKKAGRPKKKGKPDWFFVFFHTSVFSCVESSVCMMVSVTYDAAFHTSVTSGGCKMVNSLNSRLLRSAIQSLA